MSLLSQQIREAADAVTVQLEKTLGRDCADKHRQAGLVWDAETRQLAEQALWNDGTAAAPNPRRGVEWALEENTWFLRRRRFNFLHALAAGWRHTGEEEYVRAAHDYLVDWMETRQPCTDAYIDASIRLCQCGTEGWIGTLPCFLDHPLFDEAFVARMVEYARVELEWMRTKEIPRTRLNHRLHIAIDLLWSGLRLSFLPEAAGWRQVAVRALNDGFLRYFQADGTPVEKEPHYVNLFTAFYDDKPLLAKAFPELGLKVDIARLARCHDYALHCTKPSGYENGLNDSTSAYEGSRPNHALAARAAFRRSTGLPDALPPTSAFFPDAGQVFMRTGWDQNAAMVTFDGTRDVSQVAHNHLSLNAIMLHAYGRTLLMDPGFLTYIMGTFRGSTEQSNIAGPHGKSTRAHNTVNLNGWNQWKVSPEWTRHWSAPGCDAVACRYTGGYWPGRFGWWFFEGGGHGIAATHDRFMYWMHDLALVVVDFLARWNEQTHGDAKHQKPSIEANWQFCPGAVHIDAEARRVVTGHADANVLMLFPVVPEGTKFSLHEGETDPFRGWIGDPIRWENKYHPAPQLALTADPMPDYYGHFVTVIVPYRGTAAPTVKAEATPAVPGQPAPGHLRLNWGDGTSDEVWWTHALDSALMAAGDFETDASLVHLRRSQGGKRLGGAFVNGTWCSPHCGKQLDEPGMLVW